ncbi:MAG: hypothetical protein ACRENL_11435 [Candidatus Dormibacteria bacterium]
MPRYTTEDCAACGDRFCVKHIVAAGGRWLCRRCARREAKTAAVA